jgi:tryptophanyl-tRNA synthetase
MTDSTDDIAKKIRKAKTDADGLPSEKDGMKDRPEATNLVGIFAALSGVADTDVLAQFGGGQFSTFKNALADLAVARLAPITQEMNRLLADPVHVETVLADGASRARAIAAPVMQDVKKIVGFM